MNHLNMRNTITDAYSGLVKRLTLTTINFSTTMVIEKLALGNKKIAVFSSSEILKTLTESNILCRM